MRTQDRVCANPVLNKAPAFVFFFKRRWHAVTRGLPPPHEHPVAVSLVSSVAGSRAMDAGVPAITTTGIYPGTSNIMAAHMISIARKVRCLLRHVIQVPSLAVQKHQGSKLCNCSVQTEGAAASQYGKDAVEPARLRHSYVTTLCVPGGRCS